MRPFGPAPARFAGRAALREAAQLAPGAQRPGLADLLWLPLVGLLAALTLRGGAGWLGARAGMRLVRRRLTRDPLEASAAPRRP